MRGAAIGLSASRTRKQKAILWRRCWRAILHQIGFETALTQIQASPCVQESLAYPPNTLPGGVAVQSTATIGPRTEVAHTRELGGRKASPLDVARVNVLAPGAQMVTTEGNGNAATLEMVAGAIVLRTRALTARAGPTSRLHDAPEHQIGGRAADVLPDRCHYRASELGEPWQAQVANVDAEADLQAEAARPVVQV